jgi:hypothetical protein
MVPCRCPQKAIPILNCAAAARALWAENKLLATRAPFFDYPLRVLLLPLSLPPI